MGHFRTQTYISSKLHTPSALSSNEGNRVNNNHFRGLRAWPHELRFPVPLALGDPELVHAALQRRFRAISQVVRNSIGALFTYAMRRLKQPDQSLCINPSASIRGCWFRLRPCHATEGGMPRSTRTSQNRTREARLANMVGRRVSRLGTITIVWGSIPSNST